MKITSKITGNSNHYSLISPNINELNSQIKKHRLTDWISKKDTTFCCILETPLSDKSTPYFRVTLGKAIFQENCPKKKAGVAIIITNIIDVQPKVVKKDKEGHMILVKGSLPRETQF